jgi:hypothetical protein
VWELCFTGAANSWSDHRLRPQMDPSSLITLSGEESQSSYTNVWLSHLLCSVLTDAIFYVETQFWREIIDPRSFAIVN